MHGCNSVFLIFKWPNNEVACGVAALFLISGANVTFHAVVWVVCVTINRVGQHTSFLSALSCFVTPATLIWFPVRAVWCNHPYSLGHI